jgi:mannobiose 2-epimerase
MLESDGRPADTRKKVYGQAFLVYALTEYAAATGTESALDMAWRLWKLVDEKAHDDLHLGYDESFERDWTLTEDSRLSDVDLDERKSMNAHLHILEALTTLYRSRPEDLVRERLEECLEVFEDQIADPDTSHLRLFFDEAWNNRSDRVSFGHDIEACWLLCEAAEALEGSASRVGALTVDIAEAVLAEGVDPDGGLMYEADPTGVIDTDKHWWVQAEAAVGFLNSFELTRDERFLTASRRAFDFAQGRIVDPQHGGWHWLVSRDGVPDLQKPKISAWKCPYHNARMCLELIRRLGPLEGTVEGG